LRKKKKDNETTSNDSECPLDSRLVELLTLIFDQDMFQEKMKSLDIDLKKMPLGNISGNQLAKGYQALEELENQLNGAANPTTLSDLSNRFYTIIPHDFGFSKPPIIDNKELLQKKYDLLEVLSDIEVAARMLEKKKYIRTSSSNKIQTTY